jgi:hypothetical protein
MLSIHPLMVTYACGAFRGTRVHHHCNMELESRVNYDSLYMSICMYMYTCMKLHICLALAVTLSRSRSEPELKLIIRLDSNTKMHEIYISFEKPALFLPKWSKFAIPRAQIWICTWNWAYASRVYNLLLYACMRARSIATVSREHKPLPVRAFHALNQNRPRVYMCPRAHAIANPGPGNMTMQRLI